ncbi:aminotransferase class IV [Streptomyces sp. NRRL F-2664]|uniref:aminotransferase class IV n=1 Tax=Streptomyces sp. NRRL F-2664 TaxID=1463842 RepID=UPI0006924A67|nr:aminotransferase class IV [Streptomyces sp. NRRL F-2664]
MNEPAKLMWWQGRVVPAGDTALTLANHSLHYGICVFEGISAFPSGADGHHVFRLEEHLNRFAESCRLVGISLAQSPAELAAACHETVTANGLRRAYLRPVAFLGDGVLGLAAPGAEAQVAVLAFDVSSFDAVIRAQQPRLTLSPVARLSPHAFPTKAKVSAGYLGSRVAWMDARRRGFDDALLLDDTGSVAECTVQNVFGVRGRTLLVPDSPAALDGITVASVIEIAAALGLDVDRGPLAPADLTACDALCVASTAGGVRPVRCVDDVVFDTDNAVVAEIVRDYQQAELGLLPGREQWTARP